MKLIRLPISHKLFLVFAIIILLFTLISLNIIIHINRSVDSTKAIYHHPYTVSNSVRDIEKNVISLHRSLNELLLTTDQTEYSQILDIIKLLEININSKFEIVFERYLGPRQDVEAAYEGFQQFKNTSEDVILQLDSNNYDQAAFIVSGEGAKQLVGIISKLQISKHFCRS